MTIVQLVDAVDPEQWGAKAASLARALRAGLPVPPGRAFADADVTAVVDSIDESILTSTLRAVGPRVAVRSSAIGEDGAATSFAGQHETILNVRAPATLRAAMSTIRASAISDGALAYRQRLGAGIASHERARVAILVQHQIAATTAGVLFSRDPVSGRDESVIEAALGLGESVVGGLVTPDRYRLSRDGTLLSFDAGTKDCLVRLGADEGTVRDSVDGAAISSPCLDRTAIAQLHALVASCDEIFNGPHDIEWAFAGDKLFLLQRRPLTRGGRA